MTQKSDKRLPPIHLLETLEAVAETKSLSKAAAVLSITDSAVSHRIKELESILSKTIFRKESRQVLLTEDGIDLYNRTSKALDILRLAVAQAPQEISRLRISVLPSFARFRLMPALEKFYERNPNIKIDIDATVQLADLSGGQADIAIRLQRLDVIDGHAEVVVRDKWVAVAHPEYKHNDFSRLDERSMGSIHLLSHTRQPWQTWFRKADISHKMAVYGSTFNDSGLMIDAVLRKQGVALVRLSLVVELLSRSELRVVSDIFLDSEHFNCLLATSKTSRSVSGRIAINWVRKLLEDGQYDTQHNDNDCP